jgi:spermidine synthase
MENTDERELWPWPAMGLQTLSGFACLGYEIVWTEQLGVALGHEYVAVLAVLAAFFGGLCVGARLLARAIARSTRPGRLYAACEALIALWALLLGVALPAATGWLAARIGSEPSAAWHWAIAFGGPLVLLLPATCAMGATLPAIERAVTGAGARGTAIAALYAANTLGAVLGVLACTWLLVPALGLAGATRVCAALNGACALLGFVLLRDARGAASAVQSAGGSRLVPILCATGALGIGYEVLVVRALSQITENTVYTFALLLAVYLLGSAAGAAAYQRWLLPHAGRAYARERLLAAVAAACLLGVLALGGSALCEQVVTAALRRAIGAAPAALAGETAAAVAVFLPATIAMGALFSQLCVEARREGLELGAALAANTLGAALAPLLFGVLLLPALGGRTALLGAALGYLLLLRPGAWRAAARDPRALAALGVAVLLVLGAPRFAPVLPRGARLLEYREGIAASVSVIESADGVATLHINNRAQEGSSATLLADARQAWLPLLLHARPQRALFLGLGTGLTAGSATWDPALQVDAVELLPEVVAAARRFSPALGGSRAPHVIVADARRYVRSAGPLYDVVVADLFHPARSGAAALYTREHFAAVRARLAPAGLFCQWLPLHQLDLATLRSVVSSFIDIYPEATAVLATHSLDTPVIGLIGQREASGFSPAALRARLAAASASAQLRELHLEDELAVLGSFISGPAALQRFAAGAPPNTDDRPLVAYRAPRASYAPEAAPRDRLLALLRVLRARPDEVLTAAHGDDSELRARLAAYFSARDRFIQVGAGVRPSSDAHAMLAQVRAPLLAILRESPDFRPAYDPLLNMAAALPASSAGEARGLLTELAAAQPARAEAGQLLRRLTPRED